jgi:hypothetical protein
MRRGGDEEGADVPIESYERRSHTVELRRRETLFAQDLLEIPPVIQAAHDDQPVRDGAGAADAKAVGGGGERCDTDVDVGCKPSVEADLGPAGRLATLQGGKVEIGETHRLLQLVDPVSGQEDI